jgi:hypothetical protein
VFWSKIWLFVVALGAAVALTIALVLPRPAERALVRAERNRLETACGVIRILLADDARNRVELAGSFARSPEIMNALEAASGAERLDEARMRQVRDVGDSVMKAIQGSRQPDFAMLVDKRGRVVARVRLEDQDFGDVAAGRPLIDDALAGYLRDDLWAQNGTMHFVSAAPVVKQGGYVGAVVLGHQVTNQLAATLVRSLDVDMGFHLGGDGVAGSKTIAFDYGALQAAIRKLGDDLASDCQVVRPIDVRAGADDYTAVVARLPGEAAARQAYYSVIIKRPAGLGFVGRLGTVTRDDLAPGNFPWLVVGGGFVVALGLGIALMFAEADRPLRRLTADALRLAKAETERLAEDAHGGKFGSIARSVNIHVDKLGRDAKSAKQDLDQLLGPAPEAGLGGLGTIDLLASASQAARPGGSPAAVARPPSELRFQDPGPMTSRTPPRTPAPRSITPPPFRVTPPPAAARSQPQLPAMPQVSAQLDDDVLGAGLLELDSPPADPYFQQIFEQFVAVKQRCNEPTSGLVFERFAEKLVKNRDELIHRTGCREVRFTVYVKEGKAALKATPVKDEV